MFTWPDRLFNWEMMANPGNWLVVFLMLALPMVVITVAHACYSRS